MMRSGYRRTARAGVAVAGALVLALGTTACGEEEQNGAESGDGPGTGLPDGGSAEHEEEAGTPEPDEDGEQDEEDGGPDAGAEEAEQPGTGDQDGGADPGAGGDGEGPGADIAADAPYVVNFHGEENADGNPEQQPENLVLSEHSTVLELVWEEWDGEQAVGSGMLSGMWCLPECQDEPLEATVVLSDPEDVNGEVFYSTFELDAPDAEEYEAPDLDGTRPLTLP